MPGSSTTLQAPRPPGPASRPGARRFAHGLLSAGLLLLPGLASASASAQAQPQTTGPSSVGQADAPRPQELPSRTQPDSGQATTAAPTDAPPPPLISDEVLGEEYDAYRQSVKGMKMYRVSYILLPDEAKARQWLGRLRAGANFAKVAHEHSLHRESAGRDGLLGEFATCRWARDTLALLDALKPGQLHSQPVKASRGWALYRLDAVQPLVPISFAQYKQQLLSGQFKPECPWVPPVTVTVPR